MRTTYRSACVKRSARKPQPIEAWARSVIENPTAHHATEGEAAYVALLLAELEVAK